MDTQLLLARILFVVAGLVTASLAFGGDVIQGSVPINIGDVIQILGASAGDILLTGVTGFLCVVLYWTVRDRKYLPDAVRYLLLRRKREERVGRGYGGVIIAFLLILVFVSILRPGGLTPLPFPQDGEPSGGSPASGNPISDGSSVQSIYRFLLISAFQIVFVSILGLAAVILVVGILRRGERGLSPSANEATGGVRKETVKVIHEGVRSLESGGDYRVSILLCYRQLCAIFDRHVAGGHRLLTARELQKSMTAELKVSGEPVVQLTNLFEEARYSSHPVTKEMLDRAVEAFRVIESFLGHSSESTLGSL